jgi:tripartite ATP-independent transporter DctP family solute receptor
MKKLTIISVFVLMFLVVFGGTIFSQAQAQTVLKVGLIDPPNHIDTQAARRFGEIVADRTDGEVKVEVYPSAQLGNAMDLLQGMQAGTVEMFVGATTWLGAFETDYWISGSLYIFDDQEQAREVHQSEKFDQLAEQMREEHGIHVLTQDWDRGPRNFISTKPIETLEDLEGLKIRVPEQESWIKGFEMAGTNPTPIALAETFTGLQQGVVEATEQASNWLYFNKYHTVANNLTLTNHNYEETGVFISDIAYQQLTSEQQEIVTEAAQEVTDWHNGLLAAEIEVAEEKMAEEGVNIIEIDKEKWQEHFRSNFPELAEEIGYSEDLVEYIMNQW